MKQANNTEMDLLLRRHARRGGSGAQATAGRDATGSEATGAQPSPHLDADEMNAYAEGALPPAAQARYMAHLADCDTCRSLVTELTLAATAAAGEGSRRISSQEVSPSRPWWGAITALFAPPVLRYALPALLLFTVITLALVATRNRKQEQFVAQNEQQRPNTTVTTTNEGASQPSVQTTPDESAGSAAPAPTTGTIASGTTAPPDGPSNEKSQAKESQANANAIAGLPTQRPAAEPSAPTVNPTDTGRRDEDRGSSGQVFSDAPKAPAPPADVSAAPETAKVREETRDERVAQARKAPAESNRTEADSGGRSKDAEGEDRDNKAAATTAAAKQSEAPSVARKRAERAKSPAPGASSGGASLNDNLGGSTATRSVGGRRFRRQGSAWIDTAYNSSRSTISVARGSDQYRALVADEPGIGSIADQLGGEVIVVWKGKAYRIH